MQKAEKSGVYRVTTTPGYTRNLLEFNWCSVKMFIVSRFPSVYCNVYCSMSCCSSLLIRWLDAQSDISKCIVIVLLIRIQLAPSVEWHYNTDMSRVKWCHLLNDYIIQWSEHWTLNTDFIEDTCSSKSWIYE